MKDTRKVIFKYYPDKGSPSVSAVLVLKTESWLEAAKQVDNVARTLGYKKVTDGESDIGSFVWCDLTDIVYITIE